MRRTKIVATLGPASDDESTLEKMLLAGVNVVRLNFSHGSPQDHQDRAERVRRLAAKHNLHVAILGDLQGPKIRVSRFANGPIQLSVGDSFVLDGDLDKQAGDQDQVGYDYPDLARDCSEGDQLLLDDGRVVLLVKKISDNRIFCQVTVAGTLSNNKGINRLGGGLSAGALTQKDRDDIKLAAQISVDYLAVSFPRSAQDMQQARELLREAGGYGGLVAKIERAEAVAEQATLDSIIQASDAVMVARGDLGVEIGDAALVAVQKQIIKRARTLNKVVITATQMMESMIDNPLPTRAEVFDVANAVLDGTDAVMLSAESAAGSFPVETVAAMERIILGAEKDPQSGLSGHRLNEDCLKVDESIALSTMYAANHLKGVKAIICLTETGNTPKIMSRISSRLPIYAFSNNVQAQNRVALYRGVQAVAFDRDAIVQDDVNRLAAQSLKHHADVKDGDLVIISKGNPYAAKGGTNTMKIMQVGDM